MVGSPVYRASCSGALNLLLDLLPQDGLRSKIVLPALTGGSVANLLSLEYGLKPVLAALGARNVRDGVFLTDEQVARSEGRFRFDFRALGRLSVAIDDFAGQLSGASALTPAKF